MEMTSRGYHFLERNAYSVYIGKEDDGVLYALIKELEKSGYRVVNNQISYWVGSITIKW